MRHVFGEIPVRARITTRLFPMPKPLNPTSISMSELLTDLPRGQHADHLGKAPSAFFEDPGNIAATRSLRFDAERNAESKIFLGVVGGTVRTGERMADGRVPRWVDGGVPIGVADDRHHFLLAGSRGGKGRSVLAPSLVNAKISESNDQ